MTALLRLNLIAVVLLLAGSTVEAGGGKKRPKGDVESIKPVLTWQDGQWLLSVEYEVEVKYARAGDQIDLVFEVQRCGEPIASSDGQPFVFTKELTIPERPGKDKLKFCSEVSTQATQSLIGDPCGLKVCAKLIDRASDKMLDDKTKKLKVCGGPLVVTQVQVAVPVYRPVPIVTYPPPTAYFPPPAPAPVYVTPPGYSRPAVIYQPYAATGPAPVPPYGYPINVVWNGGGVFVDPSCAYPFYRRSCWGWWR